MTRFWPNLTNFKSKVVILVISSFQGYHFNPFSLGKGIILAFHLPNQGYGLENPGRTPPSFFSSKVARETFESAPDSWLESEPVAPRGGTSQGWLNSWTDIIYYFQLHYKHLLKETCPTDPVHTGKWLYWKKTFHLIWKNIGGALGQSNSNYSGGAKPSNNQPRLVNYTSYQSDLAKSVTRIM